MYRIKVWPSTEGNGYWETEIRASSQTILATEDKAHAISVNELKLMTTAKLIAMPHKVPLWQLQKTPKKKCFFSIKESCSQQTTAYHILGD